MDKDMKLHQAIDEATVQSRQFKLTAAQAEEIWDRFMQLDAVNGKPPKNFLGSASEYKKKFMRAAT